MNRLLSGWALALFFFAPCCHAQSDPNARKLLEKAWQAHVSVPSLQSLSFLVDEKTARYELKTDHEAFFRSVGITDADSLAKYVALARDDTNRDTSMRASMRRSWRRYSFDFAKNRWACLSFSPAIDTLKTVMSNGQYNDQNRTVERSEYFRMAKNCPPLLVWFLRRVDSVGYRGVYQLEGKPYACLGLRVGRESWALYFDPQTHLLRRIAVTATDEDPLPFSTKTVFFTTDFNEYQRADGLTFPRSYTEASSFDPFSISRTRYLYTELAVNQALDEAAFGPPYRRVPQLVVTEKRLHPNLRLVSVQKFGTQHWLLAADGRQAVWFGEVAPAYDSLARTYFSSFQTVPQRTFINASNRADPFALKPFLDANFRIAQLPPPPNWPDTDIWQYVANGPELRKKADTLSSQLDSVQVWQLGDLTIRALRYGTSFPRVLIYVPEVQTAFVTHWVGVQAKKQPLELELKAMLQRHGIRPKEFRLMNLAKDSPDPLRFEAWLNSFAEK